MTLHLNFVPELGSRISKKNNLYSMKIVIKRLFHRRHLQESFFFFKKGEGGISQHMRYAAQLQDLRSVSFRKKPMKTTDQRLTVGAKFHTLKVAIKNGKQTTLHNQLII